MLVGKLPKPSNFTKGQNAYGKQDETDYHAACGHGIRKRTHRKEDILIAEKLVNIKPARRSFKLPGIIDSIIASLPDNCLVKDFDVLFNPEYQIDVLQVLVASCKKKNFSIRWPGTYNDGKLMYAETGYSDFKTFDLDKYDVTCVV